MQKGIKRNQQQVQIIGLLLICVMFFPFAFIHIQYNLEKIDIQKSTKLKIKNRKSDKNLVTFNLSTADYRTKLNWKHKNEFQYRGEMYDVTNIKVIDDSVYLRCYHDIKETALNKDFAVKQYVHFPTNRSKAFDSKLKEYHKLHFFINQQNNNCQFRSVDHLREDVSCLLDSFEPQPNSPPPEKV